MVYNNEGLNVNSKKDVNTPVHTNKPIASKSLNQMSKLLNDKQKELFVY